MSRFFLVNPTINHLSKEKINATEASKLELSSSLWNEREKKADVAIRKECPLKCVHGRVIVKINMENKNTHKFSNGTVIRRERKYNNFNFREVNPVNAVVISGENIPKDSEILIDYLSIHDSNKIFDYDSGSPDVQYYSIKEEECYAWKDKGNDWQPLKNFEFGLRVYKPYDGFIVDIEPTRIKDVLYVTTGELSGVVVRTLKACDYEIVFQADNGKEGNIIRFRHSDNPTFDREEIIGIAHDLTEQVVRGDLLIGLTPTTAKIANEENIYA